MRWRSDTGHGRTHPPAPREGACAGGRIPAAGAHTSARATGSVRSWPPGPPRRSARGAAAGAREAQPPERARRSRLSAPTQPASTTSSRRGPCTPSTRSSSMSEVADGPGDERDRPPASTAPRAGARPPRARRRRSARPAPRRRAGRARASARGGPDRAPPSSTIVPVSAIASAQPVSTPSTSSSCAHVERRVVADRADPVRDPAAGHAGRDHERAAHSVAGARVSDRHGDRLGSPQRTTVAR